jgi:hypothetical protein
MAPRSLALYSPGIERRPDLMSICIYLPSFFQDYIITSGVLISDRYHILKVWYHRESEKEGIDI